MAAPRWSPAPRRGRKLVVRGGAARWGKLLRDEAKRTWWDEAKRDQPKRGEERWDETKSMADMHVRDVRTDDRSANAFVV